MELKRFISIRESCIRLFSLDVMPCISDYLEAEFIIRDLNCLWFARFLTSGTKYLDASCQATFKSAWKECDSKDKLQQKPQMEEIRLKITGKDDKEI